MLRFRAFALLLGAGAIVAPSTLAESGPAQKVTSVEGITEYRLDNGFRFLLFPEASQPKVTVNLTVLVGSRHEGYGETGMAHLLEHMVFKGTPGHPDISGAMKERGATFNGSTWLDRTNYYETLPASDGNLEFAIALEADRMVNSPIKAEDLATEFSVVRNEFERGENSPSRVLNQRMMAVAFEWHNYGKSTIGNRSDIEKVPVHNLRAFYKRFYQPDNAMLVVAGRFDEAKALEYVRKYFGAIAKPDRVLDPTYTEEPAQDGERVVTLRRVGEVGEVAAMYHVPSGSHPEFPALQVLADVMDAAPSGRLYKALVETKKASDVSASCRGTHDPSVFEVSAEVRDPKMLDEVRGELLELVEGVREVGVTAEEVDRAKTRLLKEREMGTSDPNRTAIELSEWAAQGDWRLYFLNRDRLEKVTPDQVKDVADKYLRTSNRTVGIYIPTTEAQRTPVPQNPDLAKMLDGYKGRAATSAGESFDVAPESIQARVKNPEAINGVKLAFLPKKTRGETVNIALTLRYGNAENLKGMSTAASILPQLMMRGTRELSRQQIQDLLDKNRARLNLAGGLGSVTARIETRKQNIPAVMDILRQVLREASLPASEFEILKTQSLARIEQFRTEPQILASNALERMLAKYPTDDVRYVPTIEEQVGRIKGVTLDQVQTLYKDYLGAEHGELAIVGDFEPTEVLPLLSKALEGFTARQPYARIDEPYQAASGGRDQIETPDKANATYAAGLTLPMKDDAPDYPALLVGDFVLGSSTLSSRLGDRLRQKGGLSYGASSRFNADAEDDNARLQMTAIFNPMNLGKVETGAREELDRLVKDGITPAELETAQKGYLQRASVGRTNDAQLAGQLVRNLHLGRTMQFQADLEKNITRLSVDDVAKAIKRYLDPAKLAVVVAGDFKKDEKKAK